MYRKHRMEAANDTARKDALDEWREATRAAAAGKRRRGVAGRAEQAVAEGVRHQRAFKAGEAAGCAAEAAAGAAMAAGVLMERLEATMQAVEAAILDHARLLLRFERWRSAIPALRKARAGREAAGAQTRVRAVRRRMRRRRPRRGHAASST